MLFINSFNVGESATRQRKCKFFPRTSQPAMNPANSPASAAPPWTTAPRSSRSGLSMRLPADELEKRLDRISSRRNCGRRSCRRARRPVFRQHALLHSEGYSDFAVADAARQLFWERIQTLAANLGVFRIWTQEHSPFWKNFGFQAAERGNPRRLPDEWKMIRRRLAHAATQKRGSHHRRAGKKFAGFMDAEKKQTAQLCRKGAEP